MARRRKKRALSFMRIPSLPDFEIQPEIKRGIFIIFVLMLGCISLLGMFDAAGYLGRQINLFLNYSLAWGKWIFPPILIFWGYALFDEERFEIKSSNYIGFGIFVVSFQVLLFLFTDQSEWAGMAATSSGGGHFGLFFVEIFVKLIGTISTFIVSAGLLIVSLLLMFDTTLIDLFGPDSRVAKILFPIRFVFSKIASIFRRNKNKEDEDEDDNEEENEDEDDEEEEEDEEENHDEKEDDKDEEEHEADEEDEEDEEDDEDDEEEEEEEKKEFTKKIIEQPIEQSKEIWWKMVPKSVADIPLGLLNGKKGKADSGDIENNKEIIRATLENFKIRVEMGAVSVGPTVSQYTFRPADGVKLSKITNLSNDLALALSARSIRIEAPIPGKPLVGVEVPNETKALVGLREILSSKLYKERKNNSMIALGKDVAGEPYIGDLTRMPHLLVAGTTNSGKSVCLNAIITSLLYQNSPNDLRFIMVDPKRVELPSYNGIPHLLAPVITDVSQTINSLKWCLNEMEERYVVLSKSGKKNIDSYNQDAGIKMPYIVFIIDELADLMVTAAKDIEGAIIRLAQKSRAVGIHLILATQRPSVDVITGLIKANLPSRIAFSVASSMDSRTILDTPGAENLIGGGDMLYMSVENSKPIRLQGAFLSDKEITKIVKYIKKKQGRPEYLETVTEDQKVKGISGVGFNGGGNGGDELLSEAKETVVNTGKASATLLQRKLRIGYARAAALIDALEEEGIVSPAQGSRPRDILISKEQYEAGLNQPMSGATLHSRNETEAPDEYLDDDVPPIFKSNKQDDQDDEDDEDDQDDEDDEDFEEDGENGEKDSEDEDWEDDDGDKKNKNEEDEPEKFFAK